MRAQVVVVVAPCLDDRARFTEATEHVLVKALVAQLAVERFDEGILHGLARLDVVPRDPASCPAQHRTTGEFRPIVANHRLRCGSLDREPLQFAHHPYAAERGVDHCRQALTAEVVDDA